MNTTVNTRISLLAGLLLSGCASMPNQEQLRAQQELAQAQQAAGERLAREEEQTRLREEQAQKREQDEKIQHYLEAAFNLNLAIEDGKILRSQGLMAIHELAEKTFGPFDPYAKEQTMHEIAVYERLEANEITSAQAQYLIAEKKSEIHARVKQEQAAQQATQAAEQARREEERARRQAVAIEMYRAEEQEEANDQAYRMNLLNIYLNRQRESSSAGPYYNPQLYLPPPSIRCTSRPFFNSVKTECQ
jgi:hypothetical protein